MSHAHSRGKFHKMDSLNLHGVRATVRHAARAAIRHSVRAAFVMLAAFAGNTFAARASAQAHDYRDSNYDYFVAGDPAAPRAAHTEFMLVLMGGGGIVDSAYAAIARHAGDGHIVILRAVSDDSFDPQDGQLGVKFATQWGPVLSAETITFHNRAAAFDPRVLAALEGADGIFIAGGDQANYIRYWKGTPVQAVLNAHVRANRPIGGSSAGLAILGHYSYTALDGGSLESRVALADPCGSAVTLESDFLHYRWLEDVITDTHFSKRSRLGRLIVFVARLGQEHPGKVYGLGVDEQSALLVGADGIGQLAQGSKGSAWVVMPQRPASTLSAGQPLSIRDVRIVRLDQDSRIDLRTRQIAHPAAQTLESINRGVAAANPLVSGMMLRSIVPPDES